MRGHSPGQKNTTNAWMGAWSLSKKNTKQIMRGHRPGQKQKQQHHEEGMVQEKENKKNHEGAKHRPKQKQQKTLVGRGPGSKTQEKTWGA